MPEVARWTEGTERVHECMAGRFRRLEPRMRGPEFLKGLLDPVVRKNGWQLAEQLWRCRAVDAGHGGLAAHQAQRDESQYGLKGITDSPGPPGVRHLPQTLEQRFRRLHIHTSKSHSLSLYTSQDDVPIVLEAAAHEGVNEIRQG